MDTNNVNKRLTPTELFALVFQAVHNYHLQPQDVLSKLPPYKLEFMSDDEVVDQFHHIFEQAGDPYSRILRTENAGADIDPENDDDSPDITFEKAPGNIGFIKIHKFRYDTCAEYFATALESLVDCAALILDLQDNPGGLHLEALDMAQLLLDEGNLGSQILASEGGFKLVEYTLTKDKFITTTSDVYGNNKTSTAEERKKCLWVNKPIIVMTNEHSKSASEVLASILQENNKATLIGKRTFGKGRGTNNLKIGSGFELQVLGFYWFTPSGRCIGAGPDDPDKGIEPHYHI